MDSLNLILFVFAAVAIGAALMTVFGRSAVGSAFSLILVFFCFAGIYALLNAHLIAALQILLYTGAIMVLFIFVIMLLNADGPSLDLQKASKIFKTLTAFSVMGLAATCIHIFTTSTASPKMGTHTQEAIATAGGNTKALAQLMFSEYLLPFELVSILLLAAIIAAVAIAKREKRGQA